MEINTKAKLFYEWEHAKGLCNDSFSPDQDKQRFKPFLIQGSKVKIGRLFLGLGFRVY